MRNCQLASVQSSLFIKLKFSVNEDGEITKDLAIYKQIVQAHIRNANAKFYLPTGLMSHSKFRPRLRQCEVLACRMLNLWRESSRGVT